jgi:arginine N-succinyltransferase
MRNLEGEGFCLSDMVDIFDAGPVMTCARDDIRTIKASRRATIAAVTDQKFESPLFMLGTTRADFRACKAQVDASASLGSVRITGESAAALRVHVGDTIRLVELFSNAV